jgi:hypothetical protein
MLFTAFDTLNISENFWRENSNFFPPKVFLKNAKAYLLDHVEASTISFSTTSRPVFQTTPRNFL